MNTISLSFCTEPAEHQLLHTVEALLSAMFCAGCLAFAGIALKLIADLS
ncbi:hypothetical protein [Comamonas thiooxydans]|nr:hypothetical protein [Comamonas thiooxydans]KGH23577.1 hypothetical protein P606_11715 [Comamonas thiooxydans]